ncbi:MAG: glycosyltransferase family 2 protein [Cyanobacteriota bacterium]
MDFTPSSTESSIREAFQPDWKVPEFRVDFWEGKTSPHCVIIPVINEGNRIRNFVKRLWTARIHEIADIIIVDGGTTDGSLEQRFLLDSGVHGLLTKLGPGKLSAQLRVAYAFALVNGYRGIITIDGNDKDDPATIPEFVRAIDQGYDFVQASRFIKGGRHENTPLSRYLAIRLMHAPMLALSSGFPWTDTTQGFRAYSARSLLDERVQIFREEFSTYELLAYLSYRLPKLQYKCIEYPAIRIYPEGEVPTKISSFKGNLSLIKCLAKACTGGFNP